MNRLFSTTLLLAAALSFCFSAPLVASAGNMMHHGAKMKHSCPAGQHWVHGYKRSGKYVHGYCRA